MKIEQIYTGCLAQGAYYIESNGEAAIIDPLREVSPYIEMAQKRGASIKYLDILIWPKKQVLLLFMDQHKCKWVIKPMLVRMAKYLP